MPSLTIVPKKPGYGKIGEITLDATITENHSMTSKITQFPVEDGSMISDHIYNEPRHVTIEGLISNFPMPNFDPESNYLSRQQNASASGTFSQDVYKQLVELRKSYLSNPGQLLTIVTSLDVYENMAIASLNIPRDKTTVNVLKFTIELQEILIASTSIISAANLSGSMSKQGAPPKSNGAVKSQFPDAGTYKSSQTELSTVKDAFLKLVGFK